MASIRFTAQLNRHLHCPPQQVRGATVGQALRTVFQTNPGLESYLLDDQGRLRKHVAIFVDGRMIADRQQLQDPLGENSEIYVLQALSGG